MKSLQPFKIKDLPEPPSLKKLLGPSFILLGLGLGSGELILWPYLVANWGLGIIWGALLGITFQFFMNMEIERYALVRGESIFVGYARKFGKIAPIWFIFSTFIPWMWPGIIASSAKIFSSILGISNFKIVSILLLLFIGIILTLGPTLYKTVERFQKTLIILGVPLIFILVLLTAKLTDWQNLFLGLAGIGRDYSWLPRGISFASFLAAFAYTGAGGNLNLAQSFYIKEKGYGMGKYSGKITSLLTGKKEQITLEGSTFAVNSENITLFNRWWKIVNVEHLIIFWATGLVTVLLLALLSFSNTYGAKGVSADINFILKEGQILGDKLSPIAGLIFLLVTAIFLFATQLTVLDATSRIMSENVCILSKKMFPVTNLSVYFYGFLWVQIAAGILIFLFVGSQPLLLLTTGAVLNAVAMLVHTGTTLRLNLTSLEKPLKPSFSRIYAMTITFIFFAAFSVFTILQNLPK